MKRFFILFVIVPTLGVLSSFTQFKLCEKLDQDYGDIIGHPAIWSDFVFKERDGNKTNYTRLSDTKSMFSVDLEDVPLYSFENNKCTAIFMSAKGDYAENLRAQIFDRYGKYYSITVTDENDGFGSTIRYKWNSNKILMELTYLDLLPNNPQFHQHRAYLRASQLN